MNHLLLKRLKIGIGWNLAGDILLGIFTILLYWLISTYYGRSELGAFTITMSFFMIYGHIGVWGMQTASVYYVPQLKEDSKMLGKYFFSFLCIVIFVSIMLAIFTYNSAFFIGNRFFGSDLVGAGLKNISLASILFAINKLIAGYFNGMNCMRVYAFLQTVRYALILLFVFAMVCFAQNFHMVFNCFLYSEIHVLIIGSIMLFRKITIQSPERNLIADTGKFGMKAMFGNVISDINTRIDVMMLGGLCGDTVAGQYSFITIIAEGLLLVLFVFRSNYNPVFSKMIYNGDFDELEIVFKDLRNKMRLLFGIGGILLFVGYCFFCVLFLGEEFINSILPAGIVILGCFVMAPYFVCGNLCTLLGKPIIDTKITFYAILINILLNVILIRICGIFGAALATTFSHSIYAIVTKRYIIKYAHMHI